MIINNKNTNKDFSSFNQLISSIKQNLNDNENIITLFINNVKKILNNENINEKELEMTWIYILNSYLQKLLERGILWRKNESTLKRY